MEDLEFLHAVSDAAYYFHKAEKGEEYINQLSTLIDLQKKDKQEYFAHLISTAGIILDQYLIKVVKELPNNISDDKVVKNISQRIGNDLAAQTKLNS